MSHKSESWAPDLPVRRPPAKPAVRPGGFFSFTYALSDSVAEHVVRRVEQPDALQFRPALTAWQVGLGCAPMVVLGAIFEAPDLHALTKSGWAAMLYMASVPMGICYLSWFAALRKLRPIEAAGLHLLKECAFLGAAAKPPGPAQHNQG